MKIFFAFLIFSYTFTLIAQDQFKQKYVLTLVYIKSGATLVTLEDEKEFKTNKGIYAKVLEVDPAYRDKFYVYNKEGKAKYIVYAKDIVEIQDDINLLPGETGDITYPAPSRFKETESILHLESEFSFNLEEIDLSALDNYLHNNVSGVVSPRFHLNTHVTTLLPVFMGMNLNYQEGSWVDNNSNASKISIFSFGPEIKYQMIKNDNFSLSFITSIEFCPIYQVKTSSDTFNFSSYVWDLGLINEFNTSYGKINFGFDYRKHYVTLKTSNMPSNTYAPNVLDISSIGLSLGYKVDWEL